MTNILGIVRETKNEWERRVPLIPADIKELIDNLAAEIVIQPSKNRIFSDQEFGASGAGVKEDLTDCDLILGIKEVRIADLIPRKTYVYFSHTIKGQSYNMPMLQKLLDLQCTLIDYERMVDENNQRLIYFSYHAGVAGTIESLWAFGQRLAWEKIRSPFTSIKQALTYRDQAAAETAFAALGNEIKTRGLPAAIAPLVIGITGYGNVSRGVQHMLDLLPLDKITPAELPGLHQREKGRNDRIYQVIFKEEDMVAPLTAERPFDLQDYYRHPQNYRADFQKYLPELDILINASFWDSVYPRHVSKEGLHMLFSQAEKPRLRVIGDISCDVDGGIQCTARVTDPGNPVYVYDPQTDKIEDGFAGQGPVIMAVDNLPSELPKDASVYFSSVLKTLVPDLLKTDWNGPFHKLALPYALKTAIIVYQGHLTEAYQYLKDFIRKK
jgi:saccharopine dehydrogenase (NAD+, L-lysine-forming)